MPTPDRNVNITGVFTYTSTNQRTGAVSTGTLGTYSIFRDVETTVSVRTPNFRKLKPSQLPNNGYHHYRMKVSDPRSSFTTFSQSLAGGDVTRWDYSMNAKAFGCNENVPASDAADDPTQRAIGKILEDIRTGKSNLAVTMAEMDKTAKMVVQSATRIFKAARNLKNARFGDFARDLGVTTTSRQSKNFYTALGKAVRSDTKDQTWKWKKKVRTSAETAESRTSSFLADTWLEFSYGWKPLLSDVYALAQSTAALMVDYQYVVRSARGKAKTEGFFRNKWRPDGNQVFYETYTEDRIWADVEVLFRIPPGGISISDAFGLSNPAEVAWELVPFSFVADWFLPIGDYIRNLLGYNGLVFAGGFQSFKHERTYKTKVYGAGESTIGGTRWFGQSGGGELVKFEYDQGRSALTSFPPWGTPKFKDPRSFAHAVSAVSLLQTLFLRRGNR